MRGLYACGLRVTELVSLTLDQLNTRQGVVRVTGKGSKERLVPMGETALDWIVRYLKDGRGELLGGAVTDCLFPSQRGQQMTRQTFWYRIKLHAQVAGIRSHYQRIRCGMLCNPSVTMAQITRGADVMAH